MPSELFALSAPTEDLLPHAAAALLDSIDADGDPPLRALAFAVDARPAHDAHRAAVVADGTEHLAAVLRDVASSTATPLAVRGSARSAPRVAFVFSGVGSQWRGMAAGLYAGEPAFREAVDACDDVFEGLAGWSIADVLRGCAADLQRSAVAQPAIFAVQVGLEALLRSWGVVPDAAVGHSVGEVAAAYTAGVLTLADAVTVVRARSELMDGLSGCGGMAAIARPACETVELLAPYGGRISIAASNSPGSTVVSGPSADVDDLCRVLTERGDFARRIHVDVAAHSSAMDTIRGPLETRLADLVAKPPALYLASSVLGGMVDGELLDGAYWGRNLRQTVRFADAARALVDGGIDTFVELAPHPMLTRGVLEVADVARREVTALSTLRRDGDDRAELLRVVGDLFVRGLTPRWRAMMPAADSAVLVPPRQWRRQSQPHLALPATAPATSAAATWVPHGTVVAERSYVVAIDMRADRWLADHVVRGQAIAPAALYCTIAATAARQCLGLERCDLVDVAFRHALVLDDDTNCVLRVDFGNAELNGTAFDVVLDGEEVVVATGRVEAASASANPAPVRAVLARCRDERDVATFYDMLGERGLEYRSAFRGISRLWEGADEAIADVEGPDGPGLLPPAVIDSCFQVLGAALRTGAAALEELYVPVRIGRLRVDAAAGSLWAHASVTRAGRTGIVGDVVVTTDDGRVVLEAEDIGLRPITAGDRGRTLLDDCYRVEWELVGPALSPSAELRSWVLVPDRAGLAEGVAAVLRDGGTRCTVVDADDATALGVATETLRATGGDPVGIVICLDPTDAPTGAPDVVAARGALTARVLGLLRDVAPLEPAEVVLVTRSAVRVVDGDDVSGLLQSPARAVGSSAVLERLIPAWRTVDIAADSPSSAAVAGLAQELSAGDEDAVAIRGVARFGARLRRSPLAPSAPEPLGVGTHLVTGGLGALGLVTLEWLAARGATHVVLVGRSAPSPEAAAVIDGARANGVDVRVVAADVADEDDVRRLVTDIVDLPPLVGVFHLAGVLDDRFVVNTDGDDLARVMAPKDAGAWNLHAATRHLALDHFVLYSSAASVLGSPGQAAYAGANAFLDALAHHRRSLGLPGQSVNWGVWSIGKSHNDTTDRLGRLGLGKILPAAAAAALDAVLASDDAQVAVIPADWAAVQRTWRGRPSTFLAEVVGGAALGSAVDVGLAGELRDLDGPERRGRLEDLIRTTVVDVLRVPADDLDGTVLLDELGLDSLLGLELKERIEAELGVSIPMVAFLDEATLEQVVDAAEEAVLTGEDRPELRTRIVPDVVGRFEPFPLKDIQQAYLLGRSAGFALGGVGVHVYTEVDARGLDVGRLERAAWRLVERHDMLRTVVLDDGRQQVLESVAGPLVEVVDLRGVDAGVVAQRLGAARDGWSHEVLAADRAPMFRVVAHLLDGGVTRVHVGVDMLILDATSLLMLMAEFGRFYEDPDLVLAPLEITFRDYVLAELALEESDAVRGAQEYWERRLESLPAAPQLALAAEPASVGVPRFVRRRAELDAQRWGRLKDRIAGLGLTPSMALCAAYAEVLAVWSRSPRFCLNVTLFNRLALHPQVFDLAGDFTSLELLEVDCGSPVAFVERARQLQRQLWEDLDHRQGSGVRLLRDLARARGAGAAGMPVVFTSLLGGSFDMSWLGEQVYGVSQTPQVWLDHQVMEVAGALVTTWDAVEELFPVGMLDDVFDAYVGLLGRLADDPGVWDAPVGGLVPASQVAVVSGLNGPVGVVPSGLLQSSLVAVAEGSPGLPLVVDGGRVVSAGEVLGAGRRVGRRLVDAGVGRDRLVGVVMDKGWEQVVATVAVLEAGGAYLPLSAEWPAQRLAQLLALGEVEVVLTQSWVAASVEWPVGVSVVVVDEEVLVGGVPEPLGVEVSADDLAYVIFTSGSTGVPKGVMVEHRSALNTVVDVNTRFGVGAGDVVLALSSLSFDLSVYDVFGLGAVGGRVVFPGREALRDPAAWARLVADEGVTVWNTVPALAELLVEHAEPRGLSFDGLRLVLLSGDWIPVGLPERLRRVAPNARIVSLGGATEAAIWSIVHPVDAVDPAWPSIPYGKPLTNQTMHVLDERLELCPTWVPGELFIGGVGVARGYWRDVERSEAAFIVHPVSGERLYRTGDLGRRHPDGTIEFLGRRDDQVKIRGYRIELGEIEAALAAHPEVRDTVVLARADNGTDKRLVAYLTTTNPDIDTSDLRRHLTSRLPTYMVPTAYVILDTFPLTANAKIDRANLPAPDTTIGEHVEPRDDDEHLIAQLWSTTLEASVGVHDDFFHLGGDSLIATAMLGQLKEHLDIEISMRELYADPTVAGLATAVRDARTHGRTTTKTVIVHDAERRLDPFPLTDVQHAYWLGRQGAFSLGGISAQSYFEIDAPKLDVEALERAAHRLVERHDMLRTVVLDDGRQQVLEMVAGPLVEVVDLRGLPADDVETRLATIRATMSHEVLPADRAPLFRVVAHLLDDDLTRVHVGVDMLIVDATSLLMLMAELSVFYFDPDIELPALEITFRDYVLTEAALEGTDAVRAAQDYWNARLDTLPPAPQLPLAIDPSLIETPRFTRRRAELDPDRWTQFKERIAAAGLTPSMALCAAYAEVLNAWSRSPKFTLNLTLFNRLPLHAQVNDLVGDFTALELLEVDCSTPVAFVERARQLQRQLWEDLDHRQGSGVRLLRDLARTQGGSAGMPVVFTSLLGRSFDMSWLGEQVYGVSQTPQVWLDHQVMEVAGALVTTWDAVEELFPPRMLDEMFDAYIGLMTRLAG